MSKLYIERTNKKNVDYLLKMTDEERKEITKNDDTKVLKQLQIHCLKQNKVKKEYKYGAGKKYGRMYCNSLQKLPSNIRSFICAGIYKDYDMKNAAFTILKKLIGDCPSPCLDNYIKNRDSILKESGIKKQDVISVLYDSKYNIQNKTNTLKALFEELDYFRDRIWDLPDQGVRKPAKTKKNYLGSYISNVIQKKENELLMDALTKVDEEKVGAIIYDGFLLDTTINSDETLSNLNNNDYGIEWVVKPLKTTIKIDPVIDLRDLEKLKTYENQKIIFEKEYFMITDTVTFCRDVGDKIISYNASDFRIATSHILFNVEEKGYLVEKNLFQTWLKDPNKRTYRNFVFAPFGLKSVDPYKHLDSEYYNTFKGFKIKPIEHETEDLDFFKEHIRLMVDHDEISYNYVINYLAHFLQYPEIRPNVALVIKGMKGAGKDFFLDVIKNILGKEYCKSTDTMDEIFGNFNSILKNTLLLHLDEASGKQGYENDNRLKSLITREITSINEKGTKPYSQDSILRIIACTNNANPFKITKDNRRFACFETGTKKDKDYYTKLFKLKTNQSSLEAICYWLVNIDLTDFDISVIPENKVMAQMKAHNTNQVVYFLYELFVDDKYKKTFTLYKESWYIGVTPFLTQYRQYLANNGLEEIKTNSKNFKCKLLELGIEHTQIYQKGRFYRVTDMKKLITMITPDEPLEEVDSTFQDPNEDDGFREI